MFSIVEGSFSLVHPSAEALAYVGPSAGPHNAHREELGVPWADLTANPSLLSLMSWHGRISSFEGREKEMSNLRDWAYSEPALSIKFVCGDGGAGKSRLAAEFADVLSQQGWAAGFADLRKNRAHPLRRKGTLFVVDYPEENREGVAELLRDLAMLGNSQLRLRVLFLSRQPTEHWKQFLLDNHAALFVDLPSLEPSRLDEASAHKLYMSAAGEACVALGTVPVRVTEEDMAAWIRQSPDNSNALFVLAFAVHSALHAGDQVIEERGREVVGELALRERTRLRQIAQAGKVSYPETPARLLTMAAIADELPVARIGSLAHDQPLQLGLEGIADIRSQMDAWGILSGDAVHAPKPDIIAAAFVAQTLAEAHESAPNLVWAALESDVPGGLERLARLGHDAAVVLGMREKGVGDWLAQAVSGHPDRCDLLLTTLEYEAPLALAAAAVAAGRTLLNAALPDEDRARICNNLSVHLSAAGDNDGALAAIQEAVKLYRGLAAANAARFEPDLAVSLNNLSNRLSDAGDNDGALAALREANEIRETLRRRNSPQPPGVV